MPATITHKLVIAISSSALFDLSEGGAVFAQHGMDSYADYQIAHENDILMPGSAFTLVKKLLKLEKSQERKYQRF